MRRSSPIIPKRQEVALEKPRFSRLDRPIRGNLHFPRLGANEISIREVQQRWRDRGVPIDIITTTPISQTIWTLVPARSRLFRRPVVADARSVRAVRILYRT